MKNLILRVLTLMLSPMLAASAMASNEKGNGGDVVRCQPTEKKGVRSKPHWRVLDSVVLQSSRAFTFRKFQSSEQAVASILEKLKATVPAMARGWEDFEVTASKKVDLERGVVWISGVPEDLRDENLYVKVPRGCGPKIVQAIVRVGSGPTRFYYDPTIQAEIANDTDELSWLWVHEWLRDYIQDADVIRVLNGYFHSEEFFAASEDQVAETLEGFGLRRPMVGSVASQVRRSEIKLSNALSNFELFLAEASEVLKLGDTRELRRALMRSETWLERVLMSREDGQSKEVTKRYTEAIRTYNALNKEAGRN